MHRPIRPTRRPRLMALIGLLFCLSLGACNGAEPTPATKEQTPALQVATGEVLDPERAVMQFTLMRLQEILDHRLPEALRRRDEAQARMACDIAKNRISTWGNDPLPPELDALWQEVRLACAKGVSQVILADLVKDLEEAQGDYLTRRCETGQVSVAFIFAFYHEDPETLRMRDIVFAKCPDIKELWEQAHQGPQDAEPTPAEDAEPENNPQEVPTP